MPGANPLLDAALAYAKFGWRVLPLHGIRALAPDEQLRLTATDQTPDSVSVPEAGTRHTELARGSPAVPESDSLRSPAKLGSRHYCCTCRLGTDCKTPGKHPRIKTGRAYAAATLDPTVIAAWWARWPNSNVGIATGHAPGQSDSYALLVVDVDGAKGVRALQDALRSVGLPTIPRTLMATSGRPDGGSHLYYWSQHCPQSSGGGLDTRGAGGLVVAPPSKHLSGATYRWDNLNQPLAILPPEFATYLGARERPARDRPQKAVDNSGLPAHLRTRTSKPVNAALKSAAKRPVSVDDIQAALAVIPNHDLGWDAWNRVLMTAWACDPSEETLAACILWSQKSSKFTEGACEERWSAYGRSPPSELGFGTLYHLAKTADPAWEPPSHRPAPADPHGAIAAGVFAGSGQNPDQIPSLSPPASAANGVPINGHANGHVLPPQFTQPDQSNPLIDLNNRYAVIRNIGRKMVMSMEPSEEDPSIRIPYFQPCSDIREGYSNAYFSTPADPDPKPLGAYWLKWTGRRTYDGLDLVPNRPKVLPGNILNLWDGFACQPAPGSWSMMQDHIFSVLAGGDDKAAAYIWRWMAWAVQHPGDRAEVALVLRGGKGVGKGRFASWMKRLFGQHGLQIANSKHLTGNFNGHLRSCLLLFVDEAFWAGDKQGESILKTLLTEASFMLEQKGVDAKGWRNRLHVIMAANAEWVVPASSDERRYAVFDVADKRVRDYDYFHKLESEMSNGGLPAMLHDLLQVKLGNWHPREGIQTKALQQQKARSLDPASEWLESMLQQGELPTVATSTSEYVCSAATLLGLVRDAGGRHARDMTANFLGRFLKKWGCVPIHRSQGSAWRFPPLLELRVAWEAKYGSWLWDIPLQSWNERNDNVIYLHNHQQKSLT